MAEPRTGAETRAVARKRRGNPITGWLVLDKAAGMTSLRAVGRVRHLLGAAKAGHAGTLDPLATGVLPIALGEATKAVPYLMDGLKCYRFSARWGQERDTDDAEGRVVETSDVRPSPSQIAEALPRFRGDIEQVPPVYSAVKVAGQRAYKVARGGGAPELRPRTVFVESLRLVEPEDQPPQADVSWFEMSCGSGTYVRALVRDLGRALGSRGCLDSLRRTRVGCLDETMAITLEKLEELVHSAPPHDYLLPLDAVLDDIPALAVTEPEASRLRSGQVIRVPSSKRGTVCVKAGGRPVAMAHIADGTLRPVRVFNL